MKHLNDGSIKFPRPLRDKLTSIMKFNVLKNIDDNAKEKIESVEKNAKENCFKHKTNRCEFLSCYISNLKKSLYYWESVEKKSRNKDNKKRAKHIAFSLRTTIILFERVKYKLCEKYK